MSLGILGRINHPFCLQSIQNVDKAAKNHGKATGVLLQDINEYEMYYKLGFRFLTCGDDSGFVRKGAEDLVKTMNDEAKVANGMQRMGQL